MKTPAELKIHEFCKTTATSAERMLGVLIESSKIGHAMQAHCGTAASISDEVAGMMHLSPEYAKHPPFSVLSALDMHLSIRQHEVERNGMNNPAPPPPEHLAAGFVYVDVGVMEYEAVKVLRSLLRQRMLEIESWGQRPGGPGPKRDGV